MLTSSATTQAWIQGSETAHSIICEQSGYMKGLDLLFQSCRIFMTQGNTMITKSPHEDPILMVSQKLKEINDSLQ